MQKKHFLRLIQIINYFQAWFLIGLSIISENFRVGLASGRQGIWISERNGERLTVSCKEQILIFLYSYILIFLYSYILIFLYSYILIFLYSYILIFRKESSNNSDSSDFTSSSSSSSSSDSDSDAENSTLPNTALLLGPTGVGKTVWIFVVFKTYAFPSAGLHLIVKRILNLLIITKNNSQTSFD